MTDVHLSSYTVESLELSTNRTVKGNIQAVSVEDALRFERAYFGEPHYRVLRAYPTVKPTDNHCPPAEAEAVK